jgi:hypothetical protein
MASLVSIHRVTIIADSSLEERLVERFLQLGARGYNVTSCRGKGLHAVMEDNPLSSRHSAEIRIELLVQESVATAILDFIYSAEFSPYALMGYVDQVQIPSSETF